MHALIIEDQPLIAMAIEDALRETGWSSFEFASSEQDAIDAADRRCPDLVTSDVQLAPGCGIRAIAAICADKAVPVVFITGVAGEADARLGIHEVVRKPFTAADIVQAVRRVTA